MSRQSIMDMDLSGRIKEIQSAEGRQKGSIEIAGPAGNPTQPTGQPQIQAPCSTCGWLVGHKSGCTLAHTGFVGTGLKKGYYCSPTASCRGMDHAWVESDDGLLECSKPGCKAIYRPE